MKYLFKVSVILTLCTLCCSCTTTKQLTVSFTAPSPVDFSNQIKKIGIVNSSTSSATNGYSNRLEQLIAMEEAWLAEKGTEAALTGLFDELAQDNRFELVKILNHSTEEVTLFGNQPSEETWKKIVALCQETGVDAIFSLASYDTETQFSFKKAKMDKLDMMRHSTKVSAQEITLNTLIENGWRIYDPKQRVLIDEFTTNEQITASGKGLNRIGALQAIDKRRETLLQQSKNSGSAYAFRMQSSKLDVQRDYYVVGSQKLVLADEKLQNGSYKEASKLWNEEVANPKTRISGRACYNLAVLSEFDGNLKEAKRWATKSYDLRKEDVTLNYITTLEHRQTQIAVLKALATTEFED
jgi:hypothetical protein